MILLDTSAIYALAAGDDRWHAQAVKTLARLTARRERYLVHSYVVCEAGSLIDARLGRPALKLFLAEIARHEQVWIDADLQSAAEREMAKAPAGSSLVDCASYAVMRRRGIPAAFTFDAHFTKAGFDVVGPD